MSMSRLFLRLLVLSFLTVALGRAQEAAGLPEIKHPPQPLAHFRVMWMEDPAHKAVVSWTTTTRGERHVVHYDKQRRERKPADYAQLIRTISALKRAGQERCIDNIRSAIEGSVAR